MIVQVLGVLLLVCALYHYYTRWTRIGRHLKVIPGPTVWPIVGCLPRLLVPLEQHWDNVMKMANEFYPIFKLWVMHVPVVVIMTAEDAEVLLSSSKNIVKASVYDFLHGWFGTGLLTSAGAKWKQRRKILTPAFHFNVLKRYVDIAIENDEKTLQQLKSLGESSEQQIVPFLTNFTLNVICEAAMGTALAGKEKLQKDYKQAVLDMGDTFIYRLLRPWLRQDWAFYITSEGRKQKRALEYLHRFTSNIIKERMDYHEKTGGQFLKNLNEDEESSEVKEVFGLKKKRLAMLDLLIAAYKENGDQIDEEGIREEVDTFMFAGHDTTAMGMTFALLLIAEHKDVQERIRQEVTEVLQEHDGKMSITVLQQLHYLERCIKESLRIYPSAPFVSRRLIEDVKLEKYTIPKGISLEVRIIDIHRDPKHWEDPLKFDPDRFLPERSQGRHNFAYIPFSAGPRNCIGQKFAMLEMKSFISLIVKDFELDIVDFMAHQVPLLPDIVIRPGKPIHIKFTRIGEK
ncbi:hypothetical protein TKK_0004284 [Trichogramma kaykai]|uniref:Cytochrome P450 n=1 Tax=Trichogramma kaykai TaxID=54128 RepID=A0ABD2XLH7_9HYME